MEKYFLLSNLETTESCNSLIEFVKSYDQWEFYGQGRFTIYMGFPPKDIVRPITTQFKNPDDLFFKTELNLVKAMGIVPPHTDHHRYVTINIPLKGDFKNSYLDLYTPAEGISASSLNHNSSNYGGGQFYPSANLSKQINYEDPICFDTQEIHGVTNATFEDRFILTLSFRENYKFDQVKEMYDNGELLL
jgi:hypothetical protein